MLRRALAALVVFLAPPTLGACTVAPTEEPAPPAVKAIEGAPQLGPSIDRFAVEASAAPIALSSLRGAIAVGTAAGLLAGTPGGDPLGAVPVVADEGGPTDTGAIDLLARRSEGGLLVHGAAGLFHDDDGVLLLSPLDAALAGATLVSLDAFGDGDAEELWICTSEGALHVGAGELGAFRIEGAAALPDAAVGVAPGRALVTAGGSAYLVDLPASTVTLVAVDLGVVHGHDRAEDGAVYLATDHGLFTRDREGHLARWTFAKAGEEAIPTTAVAAAFGVVAVTTAAGLVTVDPQHGTSTTIGTLSSSPAGAAIDANGDIWALDAGALIRFKTGAPVSFSASVAPFFTTHCTSCHAAGTMGAPAIDLVDYATARKYATTIDKKLKGNGTTVMPPTSSEVLTAEEYAVVTRWVSGGQAP